jgi:hypothetical protein
MFQPTAPSSGRPLKAALPHMSYNGRILSSVAVRK